MQYYMLLCIPPSVLSCLTAASDDELLYCDHTLSSAPYTQYHFSHIVREAHGLNEKQRLFKGNQALCAISEDTKMTL